MLLPLNTVGRISNSTRSDHFIRVVDDRESSGGFLIFEWWQGSNGPNNQNSYDSWVETISEAERFINTEEWNVQWRIDRDFSSRPIQEQSWLCRETWCNTCNEADLGILQPAEYEESGHIFIEGQCKKCGSKIVSEIIEKSYGEKT